jgi:geranylgeranylglycerol-phosphate geranylgeranyltransferase
VVLGGTIAALLNPRNLIVVAVTFALGVSYSKYLKARGIWGHLIRGGVTAMAFIMGTMAAAATPPWRLIPLALVFWLHDSGSNVVGAICDRDGDRAGGYLTFPVKYGDRAALRLFIGMDLAWLAALVAYIIAFASRLTVTALFPFLAVTVFLGSITVIVLVRAEQPIARLTAIRAHEFLVIDRLVLACGLIAASGHVALAVILVLVSVAVTLVASIAMMRVRYEPLNIRGGVRPGEPAASPLRTE